jgi:hypothetical protein
LPGQGAKKNSTVSIRSNLAHSGFGLALTLGAVIALTVQILLQWGMSGTALASIPVYAFAFCVLFIASRLAFRMRILRAPGLFLFHALFILHFSACFLFNAFFEDAVHRRYSFLDADRDNVAYLLNSILPWSVFVWLAVVTAAMYAAAYFLHHRILRPTRWIGWMILAAAFGTWVLQDRPALHAFVASDVKDYLSGTPLPPPSRSQFDLTDYKSQAPPIQGKYRRILLFVMESITVQAMQKECAENPCVFERLAANSHVYSRYYSANQDSRTGILSLLQSTFIPYPAYADRDVQQYDAIAKKPGLLGQLNRAGYSTSLAASIADHERVLMDQPWSRVWMLSEEEAKGGGEFLCLHPYEFERSCEDRILMDRLVNHLVQEPRAFLLHEFIFGHSMEYNELAKKSSVRYYSDFIQEMLSRLAGRSGLEDTLVIITSDHGIRDRQTAGDPESYHIPLIFYNSRFARQENTGFFAHMDFVRILAAEEAGIPAVSRRQIVPIMGSTGSAMIGLLSEDQGLVILKNRRAGARLWSQRCVSPAGPCQEPQNVLPAFEAFRNVFQGDLQLYK